MSYSTRWVKEYERAEERRKDFARKHKRRSREEVELIRERDKRRKRKKEG